MNHLSSLGRPDAPGDPSACKLAIFHRTAEGDFLGTRTRGPMTPANSARALAPPFAIRRLDQRGRVFSEQKGAAGRQR